MKPAYTILDQIALLKQRGVLFEDETKAAGYLQNISYYRLKGYWWDLQSDPIQHIFCANTYFEDIVELYCFDKQFRIILFDAIESIEIALRTKLIYHLSISYGGLWYKNAILFKDTTVHQYVIGELQKEFDRSQEIFIKNQRSRYPGQDADAWKILEVASMGTLSKLYKNLQNQLPQKAAIANEMGINSTLILSSWLESIAYIRNIIAHHARLWNRTMVKKPCMQLNNPVGAWFSKPLKQGQLDKPFSTISCMVYLCNMLSPLPAIRAKIIDLFNVHPKVPIYKLGFFNGWQNEPLWRT
ncbi:CAAX amino protease [Bacteroidia bacterium]|nr:CAAX amino protease [Bacteroidia bacterium]GHT80202.1 CAAX amino protease [Bacteroidia bacterium]